MEELPYCLYIYKKNFIYIKKKELCYCLEKKERALLLPIKKSKSSATAYEPKSKKCRPTGYNSTYNSAYNSTVEELLLHIIEADCLFKSACLHLLE